MATTNCCTAARRLSDLLQEQQEPFLLLHLLLQDDHDDDSATPARARTPAAAASAARRRSLLRGSTATVTKLARRWADDVLAGCFPCAGAARQRFRRLPRPDRDDIASLCCPEPDDGGGDGGAVGCGRQQRLSPVSVLDLHSDDESSTVPSHRDEHSDDDGNGNGKPSTSGAVTSPSAPSTPAVEVERFQRKSVAFASAWEWESVAVSLAADISSWIPSLVVELDLSGSPRDDWRRLVRGGRGEEEARQVAQSIEAMIFEEVRWEAIRDMLSLPQH